MPLNTDANIEQNIILSQPVPFGAEDTSLMLGAIVHSLETRPSMVTASEEHRATFTEETFRHLRAQRMSGGDYVLRDTRDGIIIADALRKYSADGSSFDDRLTPNWSTRLIVTDFDTRNHPGLTDVESLIQDIETVVNDALNSKRRASNG